MSYQYGVTVLEQPTSIRPPIVAASAIPVFIGAAPLHFAANGKDNVMKPVFAADYADAVEKLGWSNEMVDLSNGKKRYKYALNESMDTQFRLYGVGPAMFVPVYDPFTSATNVPATEVNVINNAFTLSAANAIMDSLVVTEDGTGDPYIEGVDYAADFDGSRFRVTILAGSAIPANTASLYMAYKAAAPINVTADDIIAGLEVVDNFFQATGQTPAFIYSPGFTHLPEVAAVQESVASQMLGGTFKALSVCDIASGVSEYSETGNWKASNGYASTFRVLCWPYVTNGDTVYHMGNHFIGVCGRTDAMNGGVPFMSPSNQPMLINGICDADGKAIDLPINRANIVNGYGIVTASRWGMDGWRCQGVETTAYPGTTDIKDRFIDGRRMGNWLDNSIVLSIRSRVAHPIRTILIDDIVSSLNTWLNGLAAAGQLLSSNEDRVTFPRDLNPDTALLDGRITFRVNVAWGPPARHIVFIREYNVNDLQTLF